MAVKGKRTIYVGPADGAEHKPLLVEGQAQGGPILPGTVVEHVAAGLQANASAATEFGQELIVADKDTIKSKTVDDAWPVSENMVAVKLRSGEFANVLVAAGNNITARGVPLSLNGAGLLQIATIPATVDATSEQVLAHSDEIINVSGSDALVRVRVA